MSRITGRALLVVVAAGATLIGSAGKARVIGVAVTDSLITVVGDDATPTPSVDGGEVDDFWTTGTDGLLIIPRLSFWAAIVPLPTVLPTAPLDGTPTDTPTQTPTATAAATDTPTASATPTNTPVPQGGACVDTDQCAAGLACADRVCCDSACDGSGVACNLQGRVGTCASTAAPAPAASRSAVLFAVALLVLIGRRSVLRTRRREP